MNILIVDDEKLLMKELKMQVSTVLPLAELHAFYKPKEAKAYVEENPVFDIAFLDINMRGTNGLEFARMLQERNDKVNIIFTTGYTEYAMDALGLNCSGYLLKPISEEKVRQAVEKLRYPVPHEPNISMTCFGNFEVYCNGEPVHFKYSRTKEMLAYLVDRNGTNVSLGEMSGVLFEDESHRSYLNQLRLDLINTFEELGVHDIIRQSKGYLSINREKVKCDYFDYLDHKYNVTTREYMTQYSFSEYTYSSIFSDGTYTAIELDE